MMDIGHLLRGVGGSAGKEVGSRPAFSRELEAPTTFSRLRDRVEGLIGGLARHGVRPGDRVGILMHNSVDYWACYLAITCSGAIAVKLNWRLTAEELTFAVADSGCTVLFFDEAMAGTAKRLAGGKVQCFAVATGTAPDWAGSAAELEAGPPESLERLWWSSDTPAAMMYTSGTTGHPKGAVWTHGNVVSFAAMQTMQWGLTSGDRSLTTGPFYHIGGFEDLLLPMLLLKGESVFMRSRGFDIARCVEVMARRQVTCAMLYPFMIRDMLALPELEDHDLSALRLIVTGGSPISLPTIRRLRAVLPHVELSQTYGLTEGGGVSCASAYEEAESYPESVGRPMVLADVRICQADGATLPESEVGEVWVRGPATGQQYWGNLRATAETFVDGWCRTGDLGHMVDGRVTITGRMKDMIRSGGENIYPAELELVLGDYPGIDDVVVIGVPDPVYEETVKALVVPTDGVSFDVDRFLEYARTRVASYKVPRHVELLEALPRTASGKIQKYRLKESHGGIPG